MKKSLFFILFLATASFAKAQSIGGLWQGRWTCPEGYIFDFVLHVDEFPNGDMEGYLAWRYVSGPVGDWYYSGRENQEATEFVSGKIVGNGKLQFQGYKKDDPHSIIALDKYTITFDETFGSFTGITGHHGAWTGKVEGVRIGLP